MWLIRQSADNWRLNWKLKRKDLSAAILERGRGRDQQFTILHEKPYTGGSWNPKRTQPKKLPKVVSLSVEVERMHIGMLIVLYRSVHFSCYLT